MTDGTWEKEELSLVMGRGTDILEANSKIWGSDCPSRGEGSCRFFGLKNLENGDAMDKTRGE